MGDILRTRKVGTSAKPIPWILSDGDGNAEDFSATGLNLPISRFTVRFKDLPNGAGTLSVGTLSFSDGGSGADGGINFAPDDPGEIPAAPIQRQYEVLVDFDGAGAIEIYPAKARYVVNWVAAI